MVGDSVLCPYGIYILVEKTDEKPVTKLMWNIHSSRDEWYEDVNKG